MKKNKIILLVQSEDLIQKLKEESNITFLFPIKGFSVGFPKTFDIEEIKENAFIFVNRIMDNQAILEFKKLLNKLPKNIKGIVFDDLGVLNVLMNTPNNLVKILYLNHLNCNYESINAYLEFVDSVVVSTDITFEEIDEILKKTIKPVVLYTFGYVNIMYSRRTLITNYNDYYKKKVANLASLEDTITSHKFKIIEDPYGTVIYTSKPFNALNLRNKDNVLYNLINTVFLTDEEVLNILNNPLDLEDLYPYKYLSEKPTIVKIKEEEK